MGKYFGCLQLVITIVTNHGRLGGGGWVVDGGCCCISCLESGDDWLTR